MWWGTPTASTRARRATDTLLLDSSAKRSAEGNWSESHPHSVARVHPGQACIRVAEFLMWERLRRLKVELFESAGEAS